MIRSTESGITHLSAFRICAAALNSRSTAAELGRVALLFQNVSAIIGYSSKMPIAV